MPQQGKLWTPLCVCYVLDSDHSFLI
jgi:hypothetical protein